MAEAPSVSGDTIYASLWYPRNEGDGTIRRINIGMYEVRAAGSFNISYDFERDGYVATQEVMIEHKTWMESTGEFREVAFIPAWLVADTDEPKACKHAESRVKFDGGLRSVVCNACDTIITRLADTDEGNSK